MAADEVADLGCRRDDQDNGHRYTRRSHLGPHRKCVLDDDGEDAAVALRGTMYEADRGAWYDAYFTLDRSGELAAEFDYDNRPFDGDAEDDLMVEDQRLFPRSQELLPSWHPSRST